MLERLKNLMTAATGNAAPKKGEASAPPPKVKPGMTSYPSFFKVLNPSPSQLLQRDERNLANSDITSLRTGGDTRKVVHDFVAASPDLSAATWAYQRVGIPSKYTAVALNSVDGTVNPEATAVLQQILLRIDVLQPYDQGYSNVQSLKSVSESLARELMLYGKMNVELILDKARQPMMLQPVSERTISYLPDVTGNMRGIKPVQRISGKQIDLDVPTFFSEGIDQDLMSAYGTSPFESAIKPVIFKEDLAQDIHRIIKRVLHPRQVVTINEEKFRKYMTPEAQLDPDKANEELNGLRSLLENTVNTLRPEDALVLFDTIGIEIQTANNGGVAAEYNVLNDIANSRITSGAKTMGTVLGFQSGSSNIASTETMLFVKSATSAVRDKLNSLYSRVFTLALRLYGLDVVCRFEYDTIDLRPELELASFRQTNQMMTLELLSLGLISDEEASLKLTGRLPPKGYKPLSGTMFKQGPGTTTPDQGGLQSSDPTAPSNDGSTLNQKLAPDTPPVGRGQNKKADSAPGG